MKKNLITVAELIEMLNEIENPNETLIGIPRKNGYGEIYFTPTETITIENRTVYTKGLLFEASEMIVIK